MIHPVYVRADFDKDPPEIFICTLLDGMQHAESFAEMDIPASHTLYVRLREAVSVMSMAAFDLTEQELAQGKEIEGLGIAFNKNNFVVSLNDDEHKKLSGK